MHKMIRLWVSDVLCSQWASYRRVNRLADSDAFIYAFAGTPCSVSAATSPQIWGSAWRRLELESSIASSGTLQHIQNDIYTHQEFAGNS